MRTMYFKNVYINNYYSLLGKCEYNPIISKDVDKILDSYDIKDKTYEISESLYQSIALNGLLKKMKLKDKNINLLIGGDLQNQILASNFNARNFNIPFLGVFSACASFVSALIISSSFIDSGKILNSICITSSHNLVNEKQFRFPIEYGYLRKKVNSFSSTGSVCAYLSNFKSNIKIESATIGRVIDMGWTDANDMGSAMAPSAAEVLYDHLKSTNRTANYYDLILTGDLGCVGVDILKEYCKIAYNLKLKKHMDAGCEIYLKSHDVLVGGSGPTCLPLVLFNKVLKNKQYKKILIVGTGALHSKTFVNQKSPIPAISHAVSLEVL